jgi:hypothetical protein
MYHCAFTARHDLLCAESSLHYPGLLAANDYGDSDENGTICGIIVTGCEFILSYLFKYGDI